MKAKYFFNILESPPSRGNALPTRCVRLVERKWVASPDFVGREFEIVMETPWYYEFPEERIEKQPHTLPFDLAHEVESYTRFMNEVVGSFTPRQSNPSIVRLRAGLTQIHMPPQERQEAVQAAHWRTCSPHEWEWTREQQAGMALYVLWAAQRLEAIGDIAGGLPLDHQEKYE